MGTIYNDSNQMQLEILFLRAARTSSLHLINVLVFRCLIINSIISVLNVTKNVKSRKKLCFESSESHFHFI